MTPPTPSFSPGPARGKIEEWKGAVVPDAVTGDPTGNSQVSGSVALAGGGRSHQLQIRIRRNDRLRPGKALYSGGSVHLGPGARHSGTERRPRRRARPITTDSSPPTQTGPRAGSTRRSPRTTSKAWPPGRPPKSPATRAQVSGNLRRQWRRRPPTTSNTAGPLGLRPQDADSAGGRRLTDRPDRNPDRTDRTWSPARPTTTASWPANGLGISRAQDETFTTFQPPSILGFSSSGITATSADISARINPNGFETEYEVEYGPTAAYGKRAPIPAGTLPGRQHHRIRRDPSQRPRRDRLPLPRRRPKHLGDDGDQRPDLHLLPAIVPERACCARRPEAATCRTVAPTSWSSPVIAGNILLRAVSGPAPYAQNPSRFLYIGLDGVLSGHLEGPTALSADTYVATRTTSGWVSKYTGIHSDETAEQLVRRR